MRACLDTPVERLAEMGKAGQATVRQRHDARIEGAQLAYLFRSVHAGIPEIQ